MLLFRPLKWARRIVLGLVVIVVVVFAGTMARVWWVGMQNAQPRSDALIVEGAAQYNGRPSEVFTDRLQHALDLYQAGVAGKIVTVGGRRTGDNFSEAGSGRTWLIDHGVPAKSVVAVEEGSDTLLSLRAAMPILDANHWHSVVIVTDPWHELRSRTIARDLGLDAASSPVTVGPSTRGFWTQVKYIGREAVAYLYYRVFHRASRAGPGAV